MNIALYSGFFSDLWNSGGEMRLYIIVLIAFIPITVLGIVASLLVDTTFRKYSHVYASCGITAAEAARRMLDENGLNDVMIQNIPGNLTDNFDPRSKIISLSDAVYHSRSVAALGVACHECGHAVQYEKNYFFVRVRTALVPVVNFSNRLFMPIMLIGMFMGFFAFIPALSLVFVIAGLIMFSFSALFSLVTLPTEFDASARAQRYLKGNLMTKGEAKGSKSVLNAAAMTYVAAFLAALLQALKFLALFLMFRNRRD